MTAAESILKRLSESSAPLAVHELNIWKCSDTAASARLRELAREGKVIGHIRKGTSYKEWSLAEPIPAIVFDEEGQEDWIGEMV